METRSLIVLALCVISARSSSNTKAPRPLDQTLKTRSDAYNTYADAFTQEYEPVAYAAIPLHHPMPVIAILSDNPLSHPGHQYASSVKQDTYTKPDYQNHIPTEYEFNKHETEHQKLYSPSEYQKPYAEYQKPYAEYQRPNADHQRPHTEYQKIYPEYQAPNVEYQKPYAEYQTPHAEYQKPYAEYLKPYALQYPKYAQMEYAKPYPEYTKPYAPVEYVQPYPPIDYRRHYDYVKPYASMEAPTILYARPSETGGYTYHRRPQKKRTVKRPRKPNPMIIRVHKHRVIRSRRSGY